MSPSVYQRFPRRLRAPGESRATRKLAGFARCGPEVRPWETARHCGDSLRLHKSSSPRTPYLDRERHKSDMATSRSSGGVLARNAFGAESFGFATTQKNNGAAGRRQTDP